jgi:hypothetical protein
MLALDLLLEILEGEMLVYLGREMFLRKPYIKVALRSGLLFLRHHARKRFQCLVSQTH